MSCEFSHFSLQQNKISKHVFQRSRNSNKVHNASFSSAESAGKDNEIALLCIYYQVSFSAGEKSSHWGGIGGRELMRYSPKTESEKSLLPENNQEMIGITTSCEHREHAFLLGNKCILGR